MLQSVLLLLSLSLVITAVKRSYYSECTVFQNKVVHQTRGDHFVNV